MDLRSVDPARLLTVLDCQEVAAGLRQRAQSINTRIAHMRETDLDHAKAHAAVRYAIASRDAVLARMRFLKQVGDQHVEFCSDGARFMEVARRRLGRDVFEAILSEARSAKS